MNRSIKPIAERFWPKVDKTETCWIWTGATNVQGYGFISRGRKGEGNVIAHRLSYEMANGPIPAGLQIDHLCRVRNCVNPAHLEAVTAAENTARSTNKGAHALRTGRCLAGHDRTDVYVRPNGSHACRPCGIAASRARYYARKAVAA